MNKRQSLYLLTVAGDDRPGIIAKVTGILFNAGCNLEDISMTVLENQFAMIMVVCLDANSRAQAEKKFLEVSNNWGLSFFWKKFSPRVRGAFSSRGLTTYIVTAISPDRTGIVYNISRELAGLKLNITDLNSRILGKSRKKTIYALALEVEIPANFKIARLQRKITALTKKLEADITLKAVERLEF